MVNASATIGVIFDMDGVLVDSAAAHFQSWRRLGRQQGIQVTQDQFSATFGRQNRDIIPLLFGGVSEPVLRELADQKERIYRDLIRANPQMSDYLRWARRQKGPTTFRVRRAKDRR